MNTAFLLMAQYDGLAVIPAERVCEDYFRHLTVRQFKIKIMNGEIKLPLVRMESSQKASTGVHISDLANWLDDRREAALKEMEQLKKKE